MILITHGHRPECLCLASSFFLFSFFLSGGDGDLPRFGHRGNIYRIEGDRRYIYYMENYHFIEERLIFLCGFFTWERDKADQFTASFYLQKSKL